MQALHDNIIELIFIFLHFLVFVLNYEVMKRKLMQPGVLFSFVWFVTLSFHFICRLTVLDEMAPLKISTYLIFFVGVISFSFGSFLQTTIWQKNQNNSGSVQVKEDVSISLKLRYLLVAIVLVVLPFYIQASYKIFLSSQIDSFFSGLRSELLYGDEDIGPMKYIVTFSYVVYGINLIAYYKERNKLNLLLVGLSLFLSVTYATFATGRALYLMLLAIYAGVAFIYKKDFSIKRISKLAGFFLIFFIFMGIIYGKGGDTDSTIKQNIEPAAEVTAIYLVSSLNSLDYTLNNQFEITYSGNYSLRFFIKIAQQLNIMPRADVADIVQEFVFIPYPTNIYTLYYKYIKDFGRVYAWIMVFLYGLLHSYLYNKAVATRQIRFALYYAVMLFALMLSFFDDEYIFLTSMWLQIILVIEIITRINYYLIRSGKKVNEYKNEDLYDNAVVS